MKRLSLACIVLAVAAAGGCAQVPHASVPEPGDRLSLEQARKGDAMVQQGMTAQGVGATSDSAGGTVGFEYWKY